MTSNDSSTTTGFSDVGDGTTWWTSLGYRYSLGQLPGGSNLGVLYAFGGDFARLGSIDIDLGGGGVSLETTGETWSVTVDAWQYISTEEGSSAASIDPLNGRQDLEGWGFFGILGVSDPDTNPVDWSLTGGVSTRGLLAGREDDTCGLGYFYNSLQDPADFSLVNLLSSNSQGAELYYNVAVARSVALTLNAQWVKSAVPSVDDSVVLGVRFNVSL